MTDSQSTLLSDATRHSPLLSKLERLAREVAGVQLIVLLSKGSEVLRLYPNGEEAALADFCKIVRGTDEGLRRCITCRSLVALGACYRGITEHACHGGISVVAAPAVNRASSSSDMIVVSSCAFAHTDTAKGWRGARAHAEGLPVDFRKLKRAYERLPVLTEERLALARAIVDVAACAIGEIERLQTQSEKNGFNGNGGGFEYQTESALEREMGAALMLARDPSFLKPGKQSGSTLVDLVKAMVERAPAMPFTVASIAKAAHMTPNHFSMLFHRHAGESFKSFLTGCRINLAKELLGDLTLSVSEVAYKSGFTDAAYFSRKFKRITDATPTEWREKH